MKRRVMRTRSTATALAGLLAVGLFIGVPNAVFADGGGGGGGDERKDSATPRDPQYTEGVSAVKPGERVIASSTWGGFAEEMLVDADRLVPMPDAMDFVPASAFILTYGTSYHALKDRAQLKAGETLLVLGASGGVGHDPMTTKRVFASSRASPSINATQ